MSHSILYEVILLSHLHRDVTVVSTLSDLISFVQRCSLANILEFYCLVKNHNHRKQLLDNSKITRKSKTIFPIY